MPAFVPLINSYNGNCTAICCSGNGQKIYAVYEDLYSWPFYTSGDGGQTWTEITTFPPHTNDYISSMVTSDNGAIVLAVVTNDHVYLSNNYGSTWAAITAIPIAVDASVAISSDGQKIAVALKGGSIYVSTDSGNNWLEKTNAGTQQWSGITISDNGLALIACSYQGMIITSSDGGNSWTVRLNDGYKYWKSLNASNDGSICCVVDDKDLFLFLSTDSGATWNLLNLYGNTIYDASVSGDGTRIVAVGADTFSVSVNSGASWDIRSVDPNNSFWRVVVSSDGTKTYALHGVAPVYSLEESIEFISDLYSVSFPVIELGVSLSNPGENFISEFLYDLAWPELTGTILTGNRYDVILSASNSGVELAATIDSIVFASEVSQVGLQAKLLIGFVVELSFYSANVDIIADMDIPVAVNGVVSAGGVTLNAKILAGTTFGFVTTAKNINLSAAYLLGSLFSADLVAAGVRLNSGSLVSDLEYGGSLVSSMPLLAVDLRLDGGGGVEVWLVNARTRGMAQYSNYQFQSFAMLGNGLLLAGATDGLYLMDSTTDAGKEIAGVVEIGTSDMGAAAVKYVTDAVLDCEGSGDLSLSIISDGGKIREYSTSIDHQGLQQNKRVKLAKGIKSRYWSARLSLPIGVSVASLELRPAATMRSA